MVTFGRYFDHSMVLLPWLSQTSTTAASVNENQLHLWTEQWGCHTWTYLKYYYYLLLKQPLFVVNTRHTKSVKCLLKPTGSKQQILQKNCYNSRCMSQFTFISWRKN